MGCRVHASNPPQRSRLRVEGNLQCPPTALSCLLTATSARKEWDVEFPSSGTSLYNWARQQRMIQQRERWAGSGGMRGFRACGGVHRSESLFHIASRR